MREKEAWALAKVYSSLGYSLSFKYRNKEIGKRTTAYGKFLHRNITNNLRLCILLDLLWVNKLTDYAHEDFFYATYLDKKEDI